MTTWNTGPGYGYPPQDPNQGYYGQPGYPPPQQPYPGAPPQGGYPGGMPSQGGYPGGMPPQGGYPGGMPPQGGYPGDMPQQGGFPGGMPPPAGFPGGGYPPQAPPGAGFVAPPPYVHNPGGGDFNNPQQGKHENTPLTASSPHGMYGSGNYQDSETGAKGFDFDDRSIRHGFIRKVYGILMVQLTITLAFIATFLYHEPTKRFVHAHHEIWWIALVVMFVCLIAMACCGNIRRKAPLNFIFLGLFTLAESFMLAAAASNYDSEAVLMAVGITTAVCLGLTLFAFQTRWDFTMMGGILFVAVIILFVFGIVAIFVKGKIITLVYASLGALIFSVYLIYDTQLMMGGKHKYSISPEEYIFAALNLYLDIINIFLYILTIIGASRD